MSTAELNVEYYRSMAEIANDEDLMTRLMKYAIRLAKKKKEDPTLMTEEAFFAKLKESEDQIARGEGMEKLPHESLTDFLNRNGYGI